MTLQDTAKTKKGPPKFQHLPRARAKQLKSAWVQTRKIKTKWRAEKRREGIETPRTAPEAEIPVANVPDTRRRESDHQCPLADVHTGSKTPPSSRSEGHPVKGSNSRTISERIPRSKLNQAVGSSQKDRRPERRDNQTHPNNSNGHRGKKPSMRNRMSALLDKIQREIGQRE